MFCVTGPSFECCSGFAEFWRRESLPFSSWLQKVRECNAWASITMESNIYIYISIHIYCICVECIHIV